jgi:hypothetical protein
MLGTKDVFSASGLSCLCVEIQISPSQWCLVAPVLN